jgi:hypothetical protein
MSVIVTAQFGDQEFEVEIFHDGGLEFLDYDLAYDRAAFEFGYPVTNAIKLLNKWKSEPIDTIKRQFHSPGINMFNILDKVRDDWFEYVIELIKEGHTFNINAGLELKNQTAWQIRRFVDLMEAIGQGLPWPPLEATP